MGGPGPFPSPLIAFEFWPFPFVIAIFYILCTETVLDRQIKVPKI
jgi:hypothetical protein